MIKIKNGLSYNKNGWKYISIYGNARDRGKAYGELCVDEFIKIQEMLKFLIYETYGIQWVDLIVDISKDFKEITKEKYPEFYEEMEGIAEGCCKTNVCKTTVDEIIAWNFYCSISYWINKDTVRNKSKSEFHVGKEGGGGGGSKDRCSAFIAVGKDWTEDGQIVCAHNSFCDYIDGQYSNIILDLHPEERDGKKGCRIIMQTSACMIWSGTDFFITSNGIIGTETTIGGFIAYAKKIPIGYRIRDAMQYGRSLDNYCEILLEGNSGDYANSWLFGDINTNEILRIELGLKFHNIERTKNGYFIGFNAPYDQRIRNIEVQNSGMYDIRRHQGARHVRLSDLMDLHKGKLNITIAQQILADHYDVYLLKDNNPCSRTVCSHYELDAREYMCQADRPKPYAPHGAVDGMVCDSNLAKKMSFIGRYGNSCGIPFITSDFAKKHRQWNVFTPYIHDRPSQPWTLFSITLLNKSKSKSKSKSKTMISNNKTKKILNKK